jgi:hypothetical protein
VAHGPIERFGGEGGGEATRVDARRGDADPVCPLAPDVEARPAIVGLFRRLTYLWAGVNAMAAAVSLTLLLTVPTAVFVGTATVAAWALTCTGVVLTVADSVRTARSEGLATAVAPNGAMRAYLAPAA